MDINKYLKHEGTTVRYVGKEPMRIHFPTWYETVGWAIVDTQLETVGIIRVIIGKEKYDLYLLARIVMDYSDITTKIIQDQEIFEVTLETDDVFIQDRIVMQDGNIPYIIFNYFISYGKLPYFVDDGKLSMVLLDTKSQTGMDLNFGMLDFDLIEAQLSRDPDDISVYYRHTDRKKPRKFVKMRSVLEAPDNASSAILGSYMHHGILRQLTTENTEPNFVENHLRF